MLQLCKVMGAHMQDLNKYKENMFYKTTLMSESMVSCVNILDNEIHTNS